MNDGNIADAERNPGRFCEGDKGKEGIIVDGEGVVMVVGINDRITDRGEGGGEELEGRMNVGTKTE